MQSIEPLKPTKMVLITVTVKDSKGILLDERSFKALFNAFKKNAMRLPMMTGPILYDLIQHNQVKINAPDGSTTYKLEVL